MTMMLLWQLTMHNIPMVWSLALDIWVKISHCYFTYSILKKDHYSSKILYTYPNVLLVIIASYVALVKSCNSYCHIFIAEDTISSNCVQICSKQPLLLRSWLRIPNVLFWAFSSVLFGLSIVKLSTRVKTLCCSSNRLTQWSL